MASKTDIANRALSKLGQKRVSNIETEDTKSARIINGIYSMVRDSLLQEYPWNFAIKRASLAPLSSSPEWGYDNKYKIPSDCLRLLSIKNDPDYSVEEDNILTDETDEILIKYIARIENSGNYVPVFNEALATRLAYEGCEEITQSNSKKQILFQELKDTLSIAFRIDAIENLPEQLPDDEWLTERL